MKFVTMPLKNVTSGQAQRLRRIADPHGSLETYLNSLDADGDEYDASIRDNTTVSIAYDDDKKKIAGWAVAEIGAEEGEQGEARAHVNVHPNYRGKFLAGHLINSAVKKSGADRVMVFPHDKTSAKFYGKLAGKTIQQYPKPVVIPTSKLDKVVSSRKSTNHSTSGTITNPKTKRKIKISTALSYPKDHPAHKLAAR